jgi:mRNA interferase RelE/StbE
MKYKAVFQSSAIAALQEMDKAIRLRIYKWIQKNLDGTETPTAKGKPLTDTYKGFWRYRVGNYRIIAEIKEIEVIILIIAIGHRKDIYKC